MTVVVKYSSDRSRCFFLNDTWRLYTAQAGLGLTILRSLCLLSAGATGVAVSDCFLNDCSLRSTGAIPFGELTGQDGHAAWRGCAGGSDGMIGALQGGALPSAEQT
jgi:hypothetical protein